MKRNHGLTLIELLVVVAIIALLAALAMVNLDAANTRAKVVKVKNNQRVMADALEAYRSDWNQYPPTSVLSSFTDVHGNPIYGPDGQPSRNASYHALTTPIAYLGKDLESFMDPFLKALGLPMYNFDSPRLPKAWFMSAHLGIYTSTAQGADVGYDSNVNRWTWSEGVHDSYMITSIGPDLRFSHDLRLISYFGVDWADIPNDFLRGVLSPNSISPYDPSNGLRSSGDLYRFGGRVSDWVKNSGHPLIAP